MEDNINGTILILRGVSGSGKSTFANYIQTLKPTAEICCADDYFINQNGEYNFDAKKLSDAHLWCRNRAKAFMEDSQDWLKKFLKHPTVVIANTNTSNWEIKPYEELAKKYGFRVFSLVVENRHGYSDIHGVPSGVIDVQERRLMNNIQLK